MKVFLKYQSVNTSYAVKRNLLNKSVGLFLLTALLLPMIFFGGWRKVAARHAIPSAPPLSFVSSPPAPDNFTSSHALSTMLSSSITPLTALVVGGYDSAVNLISPPPLPEGFAMAKVPTFQDRVSAALASFIAPLLFISPSNSSENAEVSASAMPFLTAPAVVKFDFTGDGKADVSRWQSAGEWKIKDSANGSLTTDTSLGAGTAAAPADYDGDGKTDRAVFTDYAGSWKILYSLTGQTQTLATFGQSGDKVVSGDYDGDGTADLAVWRASNGTWYVRQSSNLQVVSTQFGASGDIPVSGNYDGDSKMDYAVYRPSTGVWHVLLSGSGYGYASLAWGAGTDIPVPADYDGDGKTDYSVYRPGNGTWYIYKSSTNNGSYQSKIWGNYGDQPVPADYDGDGLADYAVWRATSGVWYIAKSSAGYNTYEYHQLGIAGDTAVPSAYLKQIGGQVLAYNLANARLAPINATGGTDLYSRNFSWGTGVVGLPGRGGLDAGLSISYNSLVWTKEPTSNTMVFDANHANVAPGFNFGFPSIEPGYYNGLTQKFSYLMVLPSGGRVEFRQEAASNIYNTADSSYAQLKVNTPIGGGPQTPTEEVTLTVLTTDGTQMDYDWKAGAYRLNKIKDRNGNFISVVYDGTYGYLTSITDTLGRVISVSYDGEFYPTSITQQWKTGNGDGSAITHTYATFTYTYTPINPNFAVGIGVFGPAGGANIKVLNNITYADNSTTAFAYNSYGQVYKVTQKAADNHILSYVRTDLETISGTPTDCPRISVVKNYAENFNGGAETVTHIDYAENQTFNFDNTSGTATSVDVWMENAPHNGHSKTWYYGAGNWGEGLAFGTEDIADTVRQRWTRTVWTQDDPNLVYRLNPRITQTKVGDAANVKRTDLTYLTTGNLVGYGLVGEVKIYDDNTNVLQKKSVVSYKEDTAYLTRRIIGLPLQSELYDGANALMAKVTYGYDEGNFGDSTLQQNISPIQHDNTNYSSSFIIGRGNLTSVTRYDVLGQSAAVTSSVKYNTAGAAVAQIDPLNRMIKINYTDQFNDDLNNTLGRNTFAYPTTLTDAAGNYSQVRYRYDIGANVWAKSPAPQGSANGKETTRIFDAVGRLERQTLVNTGAYTRYEYPANQIQSKVYSTIIDTNNNGADAADEVLSESWTDGAGKVRMSRTDNPNSSGYYSGQKIEYDLLGRVLRSTVPTEIDVNWNPAGDDSSNGWLWISQEYDWKGRVTKTTNTDGTFKTIGYDGCGCAGGEVATIEGEEITETDWQGNLTATLGKRKQKAYSDVLGRTVKTQIFNWDNSIYSTVINSYNGRDQGIQTRYYVGDENSSTFQDTTFSYDGHGRLQARHLPEQAANTNTSYEYFADDRVKKVTDARGATTNYEYEGRGLLERVSYAVPGNNQNLTPWIYRVDKLGSGSGLLILGQNFATNIEVIVGEQRAENGYQYQELARYGGSQLTRGMQESYQTISPQISQSVINALNDNVLTVQIVNTDTGQATNRMNLWFYGSSNSVGGWGSYETVAPAAPVRYEYDAAGNRTLTEDELGTIAYNYDSLSRMTGETRQITALSQSFTIGYTYGLAGQLKTIANPFNATVIYDYDKTSRLTKVSGTNYGISTPFVENIKYRAWGAIKEADYGYGGQLDMTYDTRLRPTQYKMTGTAYGTPYTRGTDYKYYADGQLKAADDLSNDVFDKSYKYDQTGRLKEALSGFEARGETMPPNTYPNRPYRQSYTYDVWGHRTGGEQHFWRTDLSYRVQNTYINNRNPKFSYNADGRELMNLYDAAGRSIEHISPDFVGGYPTTNPTQPDFEIRQVYDGDGGIGKREEIRRRDVTTGGQTTVETTTTIDYYIRSTVLGGKPIVEVNESGNQADGYIYAAGALLAKQTGLCSGCPPSVEWQEANPLTGSRYEVGTSGSGALQERDPLGANTGAEDPWLYYEEPGFLDIVSQEQPLYLESGNNPFNPSACELDGMPYNCDDLERRAELGSVGGDLYRGGRYVGYTDILGLGSVGGRHYAVAYLPDEYSEGTPKEGEFGVVNIKAGAAYFIEVATSGLLTTLVQRQTRRQPENENPSSESDCDTHKKFLLRDDVINKFQNAWDDSNFGEEGKQQEQGGMIFWKNSGENIEFEDVRYRRIEGEWAHTLQFYPSFSEKTLASMSSDFNLRYIYHSHPFKKGLKVLFQIIGYVKFSSQSEVNKVSGYDYDLLKATNKTNPEVFGVLITNEGIRVYNQDKVICDFKVTWKARSSSSSGVLPRH